MSWKRPNGRDALTKALVQVPSLVIAELRLPLVDGLARCAIVNEIQRLTAPMNTRPGTSACVAAAEAADDSTTLPVRSLHRRNVLVRAHSRFATTSPSVAPPTLRCPSCDRPLVYEQSYLGGVSDRHAEQWDYFTCSTCGMFQYRQRTRKIRRVQ
jgi:hypothetical protein